MPAQQCLIILSCQPNQLSQSHDQMSTLTWTVRQERIRRTKFKGVWQAFVNRCLYISKRNEFLNCFQRIRTTWSKSMKSDKVSRQMPVIRLSSMLSSCLKDHCNCHCFATYGFQGWGSSRWGRNAVPVPSTHRHTFYWWTVKENIQKRNGVPFFPIPGYLYYIDWAYWVLVVFQNCPCA